jgi:hypothetical protein
MLAFILLSGAFLAFAVTAQLLALQYDPAALIALFWSLPLSQQIAWAVICLVPLALIAVALFQHSRLIEKSKAADVLETRLRGIRLDVLKVEQDQTVNEQAAEYLGRNDPEGSLNALQGRITNTEQVVQFQEERNQSGDLLGALDLIRRQQQELKQKLGFVIAKRRSIEASIAQLQISQEEMQQAMAGIEQSKDGEPLDRRLQKLSQFVGTANSRCEEIERSVPGLLELEEKFEALQRRLSPLEQVQTGVNGVLRALFEARNNLSATISDLEQDEGVSLADRIQQLLKTRSDLEERVARMIAQFSEIETIHKDITGLFVKLTQAQRTREFEAGARVVSISG